MKKIVTLFLFLFMVFSAVLTAQSSKQVIGQFPSMDGGFEGQTQTSPVLVSVTFGGTTTRVDWTVSTNGVCTLKTTTPRTGVRYVNMYTNSTTKRLHTPSAAADTVKAGGLYTAQFYYRTADATTPGANMQIGVSANGTNGAGGYRLVSLPGTSNVWTLFQDTVRCYTNSVSPPVYGIGIIRCSTAMVVATGYDFDDYVIYEGAPDNISPDAAGNPEVVSATSAQINLRWTHPATGFDGGGYLVVRKQGSDPTTALNLKGIYAIGNTVAAGEQVVYIGKDTTFSDAGLSPSTQYYYRIYTVDKAFNSSSAITINGTTSAPNYAAQPTIQASGITFSSITQTAFTVTCTAGDGTNRLLVIRSASAPDQAPSDGASYTANTAYGSGSPLGSAYVIFNGTGNSVTVTGLTKATKYYVSAFEFNGSGGTENYLTTGAPVASTTTAAATIQSNGTGGGTWANGTSWVGGTAPSPSDNVLVKSGDLITVTASGVTCFNMEIEPGAKVFSDVPNPTSTIYYLRVYGDSLVVNGTFGDRVASNLADDALSIEFFNDLIIKGTGTNKPNRIRPGTAVTGKTLTIGGNVTLNYTGSTGTGGAGFYTDVSGNDNITLTVNAGDTLRLSTVGNINTASSSGTNGGCSTVFNINGVVEIPGSGNFSLPIQSAKTCTLNVSGTLSIGNNLNASSATGGGTPVINITGSGKISVGGTANFSDPNLFASGTGNFTLNSLGTLNIGALSGLHPSLGPIRTSTKSLSKTANYSYVGTAAQVTGSDLPDSVRMLTINNNAGVTLTNSVRVSSGTTHTNGRLFLGMNTLTYGPSANPSGYTDTTFVVPGNSEVFKEITSTGTFTFPLGDTTGTVDASPIKFTLRSALIEPGANIGAKVFNVKHPNNSSTGSYLNRYWTLTEAGLTGITADVFAKYKQADVVEPEATMYCGKYTFGTWTGYALADLANDTLKAYAINWFGDFTGGEAGAFGGVAGRIPVTFLPQGYYDNGTNLLAMSDTFKVYLANTNSPYALVDSASIVLDSAALSATAVFTNAADGTYYLVVKGRNIIETWSKTGGEAFAKGSSMSYDFTSAATQSYGSNAIQKGSKWCIYSGDVTGDGFIDFSDLSAVDNDQFNFVGGYVVTDVTGDQFVDFSDLSITDNNQFNFIGKVTPGGKRPARTVKSVQMKKLIQD